MQATDMALQELATLARITDDVLRLLERRPDYE